jgi:hypothetical protein
MRFWLVYKIDGYGTEFNLNVKWPRRSIAAMLDFCLDSFRLSPHKIRPLLQDTSLWR